MKKKKLPSLAKLKRDLDKHFSLFIRRRDADDKGMGRCISCGQWALLQCGHFIKRQHLGLRFSEINCAGQCARCNHFLHGNDAEFYVALVQRHGQETVDTLMAMKHETKKMTRTDYNELIDAFKT